MENNYEERVLKILEDGFEKSTSEIASILSRDFYYTTRLLEEMTLKNLLIKIEIKSFTYWKIKNGI